MASVQTVFRKDKLNVKGEAPIHFRIIKNRKISYLSSGIMLAEAHWDFNKSKVKATHKNSARLNSFISTKYTELQDQVLEFETNNKSLSTKDLKEKIYGKAPADFFIVANDLILTYLDKGNVGTYDKDKAILNKISKYVSKSTMSFQEIDVLFLTKFERYLKVELKNKPSTAEGALKFIRKIFNRAVALDLIEYSLSPFRKYKVKTTAAFRLYLSEEELESIENLELTPFTRMDLHRDMFVFASYAGGLRISDALLLKWSDFDGSHVNFKIRKSPRQTSIKLPNKALAILAKYKNESITRCAVKKSDK